jgi:hypothetical protein
MNPEEYSRALRKQGTDLRAACMMAGTDEGDKVEALYQRAAFVALAVRRADALRGKFTPGERLLKAIFG